VPLFSIGSMLSSQLMEMAQILDTGSAERNFEGQLSAVFAFFESRAGIRIGNSIDRGQIDSEFVATHKS